MWFFRASPCQYILEMLEFTKLKIFFKKTCKLEWNYEGFLHTFTSEGYLLVNQLLMWKKSESPNNLCTWNYNEEINHYDMFIICNYYSFIDHSWKVSKYRVISGQYFPVFGLNTEIYSLNLRIESENRKIQTRNNFVFVQF